jgi:carboxyl-terminal processing protease
LQPILDKPGTALDEKNFLRAWMNENYLWNTEVADSDPAATPNRLDYFAKLKTMGRLASGKDKDEVHFSLPTTEVVAFQVSPPRRNYGAAFQIFSDTPPRDIRVQYVDPNSPASELVNGKPKLVRGSRIISINGFDVVNGGTSSANTQFLRDALFAPLGTGNFVVLDPGTSVNRQVTIEPVVRGPTAVNQMSILTTQTGKVGYIATNTLAGGTNDFADVVLKMQTEGVSDLILDMRYNAPVANFSSSIYPLQHQASDTASALAYMVAGEAATSGKDFLRRRYNNFRATLNRETGNLDPPVGFQNRTTRDNTLVFVPLPALNLRRVYVLSTSATCGNSETLINGLRGAGIEVILVGGATCGKPIAYSSVTNCGVSYFFSQFQAQNQLGFGDYQDGFVPQNSTKQFGVRLPGCAVADSDFSTPLGDQKEALLAAALTYRANGACPPPT